MPTVDQVLPGSVGGVGRAEQVRAQAAVADHQARGEPQANRLGLAEEDVHRLGEVRAEDERGRRPGADQAGEEVPGHATGVAGVGQPRLLGQGALAQPVQQRQAEPADDPDLRVVHVRVDQAGQDDAAAQVHHVHAGVGCAKVGERAAGGDHAVGDEQAAVLLGAQPGRVEEPARGVQDGASVERHAGAPVRARGHAAG